MAKIICLFVIVFFGMVAACGYNIHPAQSSDASEPLPPADATADVSTPPDAPVPADAGSGSDHDGSGHCGSGHHHHW